MTYFMQVLGVATTQEWATLAWQRLGDNNEESCAARRIASEQMLHALAQEGFIPDEDYLRDVELLVSGRMSYNEHRAYLGEKYKECA